MFEGEASFAGSPFVAQYVHWGVQILWNPNMGAAEGRTVHYPKM